MPNPSGVPAFGGYFTARAGVDTDCIYAWWADGSLAYLAPSCQVWARCDAPSFAALFPERVTREPEQTLGVGWGPLAETTKATPLPFRNAPDPAQPRPDDADPLEYPVTGGRDD